MTGLFRTCAVFVVLCATAAFAQVTFTFTSFDPPRSLETHAYAVNNGGTVVGYYLDSSSNLYEGYERSKAGNFSRPIKMSGANLYATGLNDSGVVSGYYYPPAPASEVSFTYLKGVFTDFAYNGFATQVDRINNAGDLTGIYLESDTLYPGFLYSAATGTTISFSVPGEAATFAEGLNRTTWWWGRIPRFRIPRMGRLSEHPPGRSPSSVSRAPCRHTENRSTIAT